MTTGERQERGGAAADGGCDAGDAARPPARSLAERLAERFGEVDPAISLEPAGAAASPSDFSSEVLRRLAARHHAGSRYKLEGEVAHGGMGAILRVYDEDLRRHLAMKVMLGRVTPTSPDAGAGPAPAASAGAFCFVSTKTSRAMRAAVSRAKEACKSWAATPAKGAMPE